MPRVNLLPWRDAERKQKRQEFMVGMVGALVLAGAIGLLVQFQLSSAIDHQEERNRLVKEEIAAVDKEITEILGLEQQKKRLQDRINVIKQLQSSRPGVVHVFDQLVRTIPDGVYFTTIKQEGSKIRINGIAQSSTRVSALMRNLDASEWIDEPTLERVETKGSGDGGAEFSMYATLTGVTPEADILNASKAAARRVKK